MNAIRDISILKKKKKKRGVKIKHRNTFIKFLICFIDKVSEPIMRSKIFFICSTLLLYTTKFIGCGDWLLIKKKIDI